MYFELIDYIIETKDKELLIAVRGRLTLLLDYLNQKIEKL